MPERQIHLVIPGEPVAQGRPQFYPVKMAVNGKDGKEKEITTVRKGVDPEKSRSWKALARDEMVKFEPFPPGVPLKLAVMAVFPCPLSDHRKRSPVPRRLRFKKPDIDNVAKAVMDAAKGVLYHDDSQVADLRVMKYTAAQGELPYVAVHLSGPA